jgi:fimbrial isopeptide formation D2 family protein
MRKIYAFFALTFLLACNVKGQYVNIPDAQFRQWLLTNGYGSCMSGTMLDTTCSLVVNEDTVSIIGAANVQNLEGIQYFDNLIKLAVFYPQAGLDTVKALPKRLKNLILARSSSLSSSYLRAITSIPDSVEYLQVDGGGSNFTPVLPVLPTTLKYLNITNLKFGNLPNSIIDLRCSFISADTIYSFPTQLKYLRLDYHGSPVPSFPAGIDTFIMEYCNYPGSITGIPPLPQHLKYLQVRYNNYLTQLSSSQPLDSLKFCLVRNNSQLSSIPSISSPLLTNLQCYENALQNLPAVMPPNLSILNCKNNNLSYINLPGTYSTHLGIDASYNQLTGIPSIGVGNPLQTVGLNLSHNNISGFADLLPFETRLTGFNCSYNNIAYINIIPKNVFSFECHHNALTTLPAFPDTCLMSSFDCSFNAITTLPPIPTTIFSFACEHNQLDTLVFYSLPLTNNTCHPGNWGELDALWIGNNNFTSVPHIPYYNNLDNRLAILSCDSNQITSIPGVFNPACGGFTCGLDYLYCQSNNLVSLPDMELINLNCSYNNITSLSNVHIFNNYSGYDPLLITNIETVDISNNPNLDCFPVIEFPIDTLRFSNTNLLCKPLNFSSNYSSPSASNIPLCNLAYNPNSCPILYDVYGTLFVNNNNCFAGGLRLQNIKIQLFNSTGNLLQQTYTDSLGGYSFKLYANGSYYVKADTTNTPYYAPCTNLFSFNFTGTVIYTSLVLRCKPGFDLATIHACRTNGAVYPNASATFKIIACDLSRFYGPSPCPANVAATVKIVINGPAHYYSSIGLLSPTQIVADTVVWLVPNISNINIHNAFRILLVTDTTAMIGDSVCLNISITQASGTDVNGVNNTFTYCQPVATSYDPNDKQVSPSGNINAGDWLNYTVRFQNTGTALATNIVIRDTLNSNLDVSTIQLLDNSHTCVTQVVGDAVLFAFTNINLPDSFSNEPGSHGYITYRVKVKNNLAAGFTINNTAHIYFDYNTAVVTNTVFSQNCPAPLQANIYQSICIGETYNFNGQVLSGTGIYSDTIINIAGCDSITNLHLTVNQPTTFSFTQTICSNQTYLFNGVNLSTSGTYFDTLQNVGGCDSIVILTLTVNSTSASSFNQTICSNHTYLFNGVNLNTSGTYLDTLQNTAGCDSIITLNLTVNNTGASSVTQAICNGELYSFNGVDLSASGTYYDTLQNAVGCDSIVTLNLTVNNTSTSSFSQTICSNEVYSFNGADLNTSGTYLDTLQNAVGCDSIVTLNLTVNSISASSFSQTICSYEVYNFNDIDLNTGGTYLDTFQNVAGCDSIITLNLTVLPAVAPTYLSTTICLGSSFNFNGNIVDMAGVYADTLTASTGCDSLVTLALTVEYPIGHTITTAICQGNSYDFNGTILTAAGTYIDTLQSSLGCDSVYTTLILSVNLPTSASINGVLCGADTFDFNGTLLTQPGTYTDTLINATGCDSIITLTLIDAGSPTTTIQTTICDGDTFDFGGQHLTQQGTYTYSTTNVNGCDSQSVVQLQVIKILLTNVVINNLEKLMPGSIDMTITGGVAPLSYSWSNGDSVQDIQVYEAGIIVVTVTDASGCSNSFSFDVGGMPWGIDDYGNSINFTLLPNPANNMVSVIIKDITPAQLKLYNTIGEVVLQQTTTQANTPINISQLPAGIYFVKVETDKGSAVKRLVVAR